MSHDALPLSNTQPCKRFARSRRDCLLRGWVLIAILAIFSGSCASPPPDYPYANGMDSEGRPAPQRFLILPLNLTVPLKDWLESRKGDVLDALITYLRDRGNSIDFLDSNPGHKLWRASVAEVESSTTLEHDYETAVQRFVARLGESFTFDALIMPALVYRDTKIIVRQRQVKWDGVIRRYSIVNYSDRAKKLKLATSISPALPGLSLHVIVFTREGVSIFENYGGIDLTHEVDLKNAEHTMTSDLALREELLADSDYLKQGIAVAFDPYLPRD
jgi:hypothetical protein